MNKKWLSVEDGDLVKNEDHFGHAKTKVLRWCKTHLEPVWVNKDGSFVCPNIIEDPIADPSETGHHDISKLPIEWY